MALPKNLWGAGWNTGGHTVAHELVLAGWAFSGSLPGQPPHPQPPGSRRWGVAGWEHDDTGTDGVPGGGPMAARVFEQQARGGKTIWAFCERQGIALPTFHY